MIAAVPSGRPPEPASSAPARNLLGEGLSLMRERLPVYLACAVLCGIAAIGESVDLYHLDRLVSLRVILGLALVALYFVLPAAVRRLDPTFRMTIWRGVIATVMIAVVGALVDLGCAVAFVPGIVAGVLLSQALLNAIMRASDAPSGRSFVDSIAGAFRDSYAMTRNHFATTLGIVALSVAIVVVPFTFGFLGLVIAGSLEPRSLIFTSPGLFLIFVYCECVRYTLIVRWYGKLRALS